MIFFGLISKVFKMETMQCQDGSTHPSDKCKIPMPAFLTDPRQLGHMPPSTCHLLTTTCHLPTATCQMPPANCNCQLPEIISSLKIFFARIFFVRIFFCQNFFLPEFFFAKKFSRQKTQNWARRAPLSQPKAAALRRSQKKSRPQDGNFSSCIPN